MERNVYELESVKNFKVETLEIAGLHSVMEALHLPFGKGNASDTLFSLDYDREYEYCEECKENITHFASCSSCYIREKDIKCIHSLANNGDEHDKAIRGMVVYAKITAPRYIWQELVTYEIGVTKMGSNSTMHQQGKGLDVYDLVKMKEELPEKTMQTRVHMFSYQTLRRIYFQRRNHKLPQWHIFCQWIEGLPFAEDWITFEKYGKKNVPAVEQKSNEKRVFIVDWDGIQFVAKEYTSNDKFKIYNGDRVYTSLKDAEKCAREKNIKLGIK